MKLTIELPETRVNEIKEYLFEESMLGENPTKKDVENYIYNLVFSLKITGMETGIELIAQERKEQIEKHGWSLKNDADYSKNELIKAALFAINPDQFEWPFYWHEDFRNKIINKPNAIERLKIAGALIAAEIDRIQLNNE